MNMRSINKVILMGTVGADPQTGFTNDGRAYARFTLATGKRFADKNTGKYVEETDWHMCSAFGRRAEIIAEHVRKGTQMYVEGEIRYYQQQDQSGQTRYFTNIAVSEMSLLPSRKLFEQQMKQQEQQSYPQQNYSQKKDVASSQNAPQNYDYSQQYENRESQVQNMSYPRNVFTPPRVRGSYNNSGGQRNPAIYDDDEIPF